MALTQSLADSQAHSLACSIAAQLCANVPPAAEGECTIVCENGNQITVSNSVGVEGGASACEIAELLCGLQPLFPSQEQTCTVPCTNGGTQTFTFPAGSFYGLTQEAANSSAYTFACLVASIACATPPVPTGTDRDSSPIWVASKAFYCQVACSGGGNFYQFVQSGLFFRRTITQANQAASSYACSQAVLNKVCLSGLPSFFCVGSTVLYSVTTSPVTDVTWSIVGALPPGLSFSDGLLMGIPTNTGSFSFGIRATLANGSYSQRTYAMRFGEITTLLLPNGTEDSAYSQALASEGFVAPLSWSIVDGDLPDGLTLSNSGVISGTPTESGVFDFEVRVIDSQGFSCDKLYALEIEAVSTTNPIDWWILDEAGSADRIGSYAGVVLTEFGSAGISSVPGVINNATRFNWTDNPTDTGGLEVFPAVAELAYTAGDGLSVSCWIKAPPAELGTCFVRFQFADAGGGFDGLLHIWLDVFNSNLRVQLADSVTGANAIINQVFIPSGAYQFFQFYLDPTLGKIGVRVNDGALVDVSTNILGGAVGSHPKGRLFVFAQRTEGISGSGSIDVGDVAAYPIVLSPAQRAYLYGPLGAGQSWPAVLPP